MTTETCIRRSHLLPIALAVLMSILPSLPVWAQQYYVSIGAGTTAVASHGIPSTQSVSPSNLQQASVSSSLNAISTCSVPFCSPGVTANAQATFTGTASLGTLQGLASGSAAESGPGPFGPSTYNSNGTLIWADTVTITREGDFKVTLSLSSSVTGTVPAQCGGTRASLSLSSSVVNFSISDPLCGPSPAARTLTQTFHGLVGQQFTFTAVLLVSATGVADLGGVPPVPSISSQADASHTGEFKLDPASPGAAYTTASGVSYTAIVPNQAPIANAGTDQTVHIGSTATLNGTGSADPDGNTPLTYAWTLASKPAGSNATLMNPTSSMPSITLDVVGDYILTLVVTDSLGASSTQAQVKVSTTNSTPVADAGPDQVIIVLGTTVQLSGSTSYDPDGDSLTYAWSLSQVPPGSAAALSNPSAANPTFTADVHGTYIASLMVTDSFGAVSPADSVTVSFTNVKPVANAGNNQAGSVGQVIQINGNGSSDANGDPLTYSWSFVSKPASSVAALTNPTIMNPKFTADVVGTYIISLVVNDGLVSSDPSTVTATITSRQDQVVQILRQAISTINALPGSAFKNPKMRNEFTHKINEVLEEIDERDYKEALEKLQHDILAKMDGCATGGVPEKNDKITNCGAQGQVSPLIRQAIQILQSL